MEEIIRFSLNKKLSEAELLLSQYEYRIVEQDGKVITGTSDYNPVRLNLTIVDDIIKRITTG